jgi:UDP-N-acetyl-D-glucosamine dehydrogenase
VPEIRLGRRSAEVAAQRSVDLSTLGSYDVVLISTDHDAIDWAEVHAEAKLIIDTRGVYREPSEKVVPA